MTGAPHILAKKMYQPMSLMQEMVLMNTLPQALLDLFTILEYKKYFEGLKIAIIGDISHSRVARSNVFGLSKLGANVTLAGPSTLLGGSGLLGVKTTPDVKDAVKNADIVMGLRIQFERQNNSFS